MTLSVVGAGLVSPAGLTPAEHAFFLRAGVVPSTITPYRTGEDEPVYLRYCPWLGAHLPPGERAVALVTSALDEAMRPLREHGQENPSAVLLCLPEDRPGFRAPERADVERAVRDRLRNATLERFPGAAGAFAALSRAEVLVGKGASAVAILAVDTYASLEALTELCARPPSYWSFEVPAPSEAAAALIVCSGSWARRARLDRVGFVHRAATAVAPSNDDNDEPTDGSALTAVLAALSGRAPARIVFGQFALDRLRMVEWQLGAARAAGKIDLGCEVQTLERDIGRLGAAAGAVNVVYGLAVQRYETAELPAAVGSPFIAWAISRDGTRGAALCGLEE
ncbi:hypothetical protein [Sorangium sp. So ce362]|uniref:hypothetical protein n=1 Tax=Sorangium sp. So ce362 TaxID=3133303 RepID=UPI003F6131EA